MKAVEKTKKGSKKGGKQEKPAPTRIEEPEILIVDELLVGSKAKSKKKKSKKNKGQAV